ncbi:hypothetical protein SAMD00019534_123790 [Acytostelium subglobosum LB1]|uniref:hypothetical protein n=1 Tax=Acytostelium subglobosum LB1 TaxID=1410327 RepID=UPI000644FE6F|nr:hypothetical protein SAMD00019534_123790 [Acytostelium subglobosum LB1]GAM29203.1 hypothetical protein SAMD00019534_123790 [Acytostelium subglobosum LB1]|eukprot:XP_012747894.1 hypothetical protein SAMD00019534_123790 [Acytostelium subglobosum LB1]
MGLPGGLQNVKPADAEVSIAVQAIKNDPKLAKFENIVPISYATQVVAGINYFVKAKVDNGYIHLRIFKNLQQHYSLTSIKEGVGAECPLNYF